MTCIVSTHVMENYGQRSLVMERGESVYLYDTEGRQYLDFTAGIAVCNLGHSHPAVVRALMDQAGNLIHCSNLYENPQQNQLAAKLAVLSGLDRVFFCNSGAEANEAAVKLARKYAAMTYGPDRTEVVSLPGGFHGRTYGALSITGKDKYHTGFHPLVPHCYTPASYTEVVRRITTCTAACFVEVVQGEGGVVPVPHEVLVAIQNRCRDTGTLLVVDEIQTGVGRTGTFFAYEQVGLQPDIVTLAKGLANGVPIGAMAAREEVAAAFTPGSHGSTFGGNPLAAAAANCVVDIVAQEGFLQHVRDMGVYMKAALARIAEGVDGVGLMWGITVADAPGYVAQAAQNGVLLTAVGENRVRFVPPLIVQRDHIESMVEKLAAVS